MMYISEKTIEIWATKIVTAPIMFWMYYGVGCLWSKLIGGGEYTLKEAAVITVIMMFMPESPRYTKWYQSTAFSRAFRNLLSKELI